MWIWGGGSTPTSGDNSKVTGWAIAQLGYKAGITEAGILINLFFTQMKRCMAFDFDRERGRERESYGAFAPATAGRFGIQRCGTVRISTAKSRQGAD